MIRSGNLHKRITIEEVTEVRTGTGAVTETWVERSRPYASVEPIIGREYFAAQRVAAENSVRFRIRYESGLTTKMRVLYDSKIYDIQSIINAQERNDELVIMGVEHVD